MRILFILAICISFDATAQVPVSQEPRHHPVFENDKVRILNVLLPPGDTTQYHVHSTPSVFIPFTKTYTGSQRINQQPEYSTSAAGHVWYEDLSEPHIKVHRVWNLDTSVFHVMDIELLAKEASFISNPQSIPYAHLQIDTPWARIYTVRLKKHENLNIRDQISDFVLVAISDSELKLVDNGKEARSFIKPGQFYWINANEKFSAINEGNIEAEFVLILIR